MTNQAIRQLIAKELATPAFGATEQFLAIHRIIYKQEQPVIQRIVEEEVGFTTAYLPVEGHRFYLTVSINTTAAEITWVTTEAFHDIWLRATSEELTATQMVVLTSLVPIRQYTKGELRRNGTTYNHTGVDFQPFQELNTFENHLCNLLDLLEQDVEGVRALASRAECVIHVASYFHNGNGILGGHFIDAPTLKRISNLNLSIDFDLYAEGNSYLNG